MTEFMSCNEWSEQIASGIHHLSPDVRRALDAHMTICPTCSLVCTEFDTITDILQHLNAPDLPAGLPPLLVQQWEAEQMQDVETVVEAIDQEMRQKQHDERLKEGVPGGQTTTSSESAHPSFQQQHIYKKVDSQQTQQQEGTFCDRVLTCRECGQEFTFTAGEQEFYASHGLTNVPSRCPSCRVARRSGRSSSRGAAASRELSPREMYRVSCAECGKETQLPFAPRRDRPVYCSECYGKSTVRHTRNW